MVPEREGGPSVPEGILKENVNNCPLKSDREKNANYKYIIYLERKLSLKKRKSGRSVYDETQTQIECTFSSSSNPSQRRLNPAEILIADKRKDFAEVVGWMRLQHYLIARSEKKKGIGLL